MENNKSKSEKAFEKIERDKFGQPIKMDPEDGSICPDCEGTGSSGYEGWCTSCDGKGYLTPAESEERLVEKIEYLVGKNYSESQILQILLDEENSQL